MKRSTLALGELEWDAVPTDGFSLALAGGSSDPWWGLAVKYRRIGTRRWWRFNLVDVHSWEADRIHAAIEGHVRLNGTLR